jgi:hypothetical protein
MNPEQRERNRQISFFITGGVGWLTLRNENFINPSRKQPVFLPIL